MTIKGLVLDTETTGLNQAQVIEMAYMPIESDFSFNTHTVECERFLPRKAIEPEAIGVHGILDSDLLSKPKTADLFKVMPLVAQSTYVVGHNVEFDTNAINNSSSIEHNFKEICTKRLAIHTFPDEKSYRLTRLADRLISEKVKNYIDDAHSAKADVIMCALLLEHIVSTLNQRDNKQYTFDELYQLSTEIGYIPYGEKAA